MTRTSIPPGFRFHPTDVELIMYYLKRKVMGKKLHFEAIAEVNIYKFSPWDLPEKSCLKSKDIEWFFFCPREKKYASGVRVKRATENGYWKTTGKDRPISHKDKTVGSVKTLVFHLGTAPKGERTDWVIHEYRILDDQLAAAGLQDTYVLYKVFKKNGPGPKNGAQYGAPFDEAEWADVEDDTQNQAISFTSDGPSGLLTPGSTSALILNEEGPSPLSAHHPAGDVLLEETDDEIARLLASFTDDDTLLSSENGINKDDNSGKGKNKRMATSDAYDIYNGLGDLNSWAQMYEGALDSSGMLKDGYVLNNMLSQDKSAYIELDDFLSPLHCPHKVSRTDQSSVADICGPHSHGNSQQFPSGSSFARMNPYSASTNQLPMMPQGFQERNNCLDVLRMVEDPFYQGSNVEYDMDFAFGNPDNNVFNSNQDMQRGTHKKTCFSGLRESIPARAPPSAAELFALSYSTCSGGSSIHIKAEVTHRAGECTNEALTVMMGGSSSCWCILPWLVFKHLSLLVGNYRLYVVFIYCLLTDALFVSWNNYCDYSIEIVSSHSSRKDLQNGTPVNNLSQCR